MAWRFKLASKTVNDTNVSLGIEFFDDAAPTVVLHEHIFVLEPGTLKNEAVGLIRLYGRTVRDRRLLAEALGAQFSVGEEAAV